MTHRNTSPHRFCVTVSPIPGPGATIGWSGDRERAEAMGAQWAADFLRNDPARTGASVELGEVCPKCNGTAEKPSRRKRMFQEQCQGAGCEGGYVLISRETVTRGEL